MTIEAGDNPGRGRRSSFSRKRLALAVLALIAVLAVLRALAPLAISSNLVREQVEQQVERWIGDGVEIAGASEVRLWPKPAITLNRLRIRDTENGAILGEVAKASASVDLFAAITGRIELDDFHLTQPRLQLTRMADGRITGPGSNLLAGIGTPAFRLPDDQGFNDLKVSGGRIDLQDATSGQSFTLSAIEASIQWPRLSETLALKASATTGAPASGQAGGQVSGLAFSLSLKSQQPLVLLAGGESRVEAVLSSPLAEAAFAGIAAPAAVARSSGKAAVTISDMAGLAALLGVNGSTPLPKSLSFEGAFSGENNLLRFADLDAEIDGARGRGIVDLVLAPQSRPRLTGTMVFDMIDLDAPFAALAPRLFARAGDQPVAHRLLDVDLRLSARRAKLGPLNLSDGAFSIFDAGGQTRLDIADSRFEGGTLKGRLTRRKDRPELAALHLAVDGGDLAAILRLAGIENAISDATGSLELALDMSEPFGADAGAAWRSARGKLSLRAGAGHIDGLDPVLLRQLSGERGHFSPGEVTGSGFDFDTAVIEANVADGKAAIRLGSISGPQAKLDFTGIVDHLRQAVSLAATLSPPDIAGGDDDAARLRFFIGGSWSDPLIWPMPGTAER